MTFSLDTNTAFSSKLVNHHNKHGHAVPLRSAADRSPLEHSTCSTARLAFGPIERRSAEPRNSDNLNVWAMCIIHRATCPACPALPSVFRSAISNQQSAISASYPRGCCICVDLVSRSSPTYMYRKLNLQMLQLTCIIVIIAGVVVNSQRRRKPSFLRIYKNFNLSIGPFFFADNIETVGIRTTDWMN